MKKNIFKIISTFVIILGVSLIGSKPVSAACNNSFSGKQFDTGISFNRGTKPITFTTKFKYDATGDCAGVAIPGSFYDFAFSYTLYGQDSWTDIAIPDSSVKLKGGEWSTISFAPNVTFDPNKSYEIRFIEKNELPDLYGPKKKFYIDNVSFSNLSVINIVPDPNKPGFFKGTPYATVKFINTSLPKGTKVGNLSLGANLYYDKSNLLQEDTSPYTAVDDFEYNIAYDVKFATWNTLDPNTTFKFIFKEKTRNAISKSVNFMTPKLPTTTSTTGTGTSQASTTTSGTNSTTTTTTQQTYAAADQQQFSVASKAYPGITMDGSFTPTVEGGDLSIQGSFVYNYATVPLAGLSKGGSLSFHLVDGDGHSSQIVPIDVVATGDEVEYKKPYFFSPGFDNYVKFIDEDGKSVAVERKAPFSIVITDDGLGMVSAKIPVVDAVTSTTIAGVSQNGAFSGATQSGQAASGTTTPQSGITPAAANGAKATFNVTSAVFDEKTGTIQIDGSITYSKTTAGTTPTAKNILATVYNSKGTQLQSDLAKITGNNFSIAFKSMDVAKAPFEFTLKDVDLNVASPNKFKVASAAASTPDPAKDPSKPSFGLFQNPLRKGLDSIPEIVSALVKNIVIPIAVPFLALAIIYTGFLFIQARGNSTKLEEAKTALKWTLIGGAIILAAYVIATALQGTIADIIR